MSKTVFQKIIDREIPATIEYEDDDIIAIQDIAPSAPVHVLIIPKKPIESVNKLTEADAAIVGRIHIVASTLAERFGISESGYRVVSNTNSDGGQTVFHLHFHLLGGEPLGRMNSSSTTHATATPNNIALPSAKISFASVLREGGLLVLMAVGLAIGFNMMNSKSITWIKKEFERVEAKPDDINKYLSGTDASAVSGGASNDPSSNSTTNPASNSSTNSSNTLSATPTGTLATTPIVSSTSSAAVKESTTTTTATAEKTTKPPTFIPEPGVVREINLTQFKQLRQAGAHTLIDARTSESYAKGHIGGAVNYYGGEVQQHIPDIMSSVPRDRIILIYCDGGECELSHHVADVLKQFGYGPIFIFTGGWADWTKQAK